jgi:hypothetical protein
LNAQQHYCGEIVTGWIHTFQLFMVHCIMEISQTQVNRNVGQQSDLEEHTHDAKQTHN